MGYEEVLIVRVHSGILHSQSLPDPAPDESVWHSRFRSIVDLERHLHANGTRIVKVFLHLSKEEQRKRLLARIDEPEKTGHSAQPTSQNAGSGTPACRPMVMPLF